MATSLSSLNTHIKALGEEYSGSRSLGWEYRVGASVSLEVWEFRDGSVITCAVNQEFRDRIEITEQSAAQWLELLGLNLLESPSDFTRVCARVPFAAVLQ